MVKFSKRDDERILKAIRQAEDKTSGEIRVHVRKTCGPDALAEAKKIFTRLGMHRTKRRNAVLLFIAFDSRQFALYADEGIYKKLPDSFWQSTRDKIGSYFSRGEFADGIAAGVLEIGHKLKTHFPLRADDKNELKDSLTKD